MKHLKIYEEINFTKLFKNEEELKTLLLEDNEFSNGNVFEGIINVSFKIFTYDINYDTFITIVKEKYGILPYFCVLLGSYNGQVCNGGHIQYFDNGFASSKKIGYGFNYDNIDIHKKLLMLFKYLKIEQYVPEKLGKTAYSIMKDFDLDSVKFDCYDEDDGQYNENDNNKNKYLDKLDERWYDINEEFIEKFNEYIKTLTLEGDKIEKLVELSNKTNKFNI